MRTLKVNDFYSWALWGGLHLDPPVNTRRAFLLSAAAIVSNVLNASTWCTDYSVG